MYYQVLFFVLVFVECVEQVDQGDLLLGVVVDEGDFVEEVVVLCIEVVQVVVDVIFVVCFGQFQGFVVVVCQGVQGFFFVMQGIVGCQGVGDFVESGLDGFFVGGYC